MTAAYQEPQAEPTAGSKHCWVIVDSLGLEVDNGDYAVHYDGQAEAEKAITDPEHKARQLGEPCLILTCGCCEVTLDEEGEGHTVHLTPSDLERGALSAYEWTRSDDGWRCEVCTKGPCDPDEDDHGGPVPTLLEQMRSLTDDS